MTIREQLLFATRNPYEMSEVDNMIRAISTVLIDHGYKYDDDYARSIRDFRATHVGVRVKYWKKEHWVVIIKNGI